VLAGDRLALSVEVSSGARAQITSTGATRIYRSKSDMPAALQQTEFSVAEDALLEFLPDALIPFAGSRYRQETRIELASGAGLFCWEIVAPGRDARGELFAYDSLQLKLDVSAAGVPIAQERIKLEPGRRPLSSPARLGHYHYFATFYICRMGFDIAWWLKLESELQELARRLTRPREIVWGVSTLPAHGLVVRALSVKGVAVAPGLFAFWHAARMRLYGQAAVPPRKVY
jgi:urease accessory protein